MARMVLLLHELPDGSSHYDWMIQRPRPGDQSGGVVAEPGPDERCLISFRVSARIDLPAIISFVVQRLDDHRFAYLDYEGPVSGDRGSVRRVATGTVVSAVDNGEAITIRGRFACGDERIWTATRDGLWWRCCAVSCEPH